MGHKVLVIDDSLTVRKMVELSCRDSGWTLEFAATGGEGIDKALSGAPDVILLDFVLPDMKAIEVCERLVAHPRGASLYVILMSAKMEKVRELFARYPMVVDFVGKPFATSDIRDRIARASAGRSASPSAPAAAPPPAAGAPRAAFTAKQREAAANAIYQRVRRELAAIPGWMADLGDSSPAMFFARRLLTPDVVEGVLESLAPIYRDALPPAAPRAEDTAEAHGLTPHDTFSRSRGDRSGGVPAERGLSGRVDSSSLGDLLRLFALGDRTGELRVSHGAQTILVYWQTGQVLLVSSLDPTDYTVAGPSLAAAPADERERAELAQRAGGVPVYVTLHESGAGVVDGDELPDLLEAQGRRLLDELRAAPSARFVWRELETLPGYVETYGRHVSLDIDADARHVESLAQLTLERLRRPSSWREGHVHLPGPNAVYARASGFSARLAQLRISASEQRVLTLVDGRNNLTAVAERGGIVPAEVARILHRLAAIDLVVAPAPRASSRMSAARPVMILEPDRAGFHAPLRTLLASRSDPLELIDLADEPDLLGAIQRERPALVILNGSTTEVGDVARAIRATPHLANVSLAAVLESQVKVKMDDLAAAGFDAVLVKPVLYSDLSKLIASSFLASNGAS